MQIVYVLRVSQREAAQLADALEHMVSKIDAELKQIEDKIGDEMYVLNRCDTHVARSY